MKKIRYIKNISLVLSFCIFISLFTNIKVYANNQTTEAKEVIFVLDRSGSMQTTDKYNTENPIYCISFLKMVKRK